MKSSGEGKLFLGILIVAVALAGAAILPSMLRKSDGPVIHEPTPAPTLNRATLIPSGSHMLGDPKAPCSLVEFGDFQCASCKTAEDEVRKVMEKYQGKLNVVFHACRIRPEHNQALTLSMAAEAAAEQGKYWEMHRALYKHQPQYLAPGGEDIPIADSLTKIAGEVKLDQLKFRASLTGDAARKGAVSQQGLAEKVNVSTTPSYFFISAGDKVTELHSTDQMKDWLKKPEHWK